MFIKEKVSIMKKIKVISSGLFIAISMMFLFLSLLVVKIEGISLETDLCSGQAKCSGLMN
jgi:hypothetical protein